MEFAVPYEKTNYGNRAPYFQKEVKIPVMEGFDLSDSEITYEYVLKKYAEFKANKSNILFTIEEIVALGTLADWANQLTMQALDAFIDSIRIRVANPMNDVLENSLCDKLDLLADIQILFTKQDLSTKNIEKNVFCQQRNIICANDEVQSFYKFLCKLEPLNRAHRARKKSIRSHDALEEMAIELYSEQCYFHRFFQNHQRALEELFTPEHKKLLTLAHFLPGYIEHNDICQIFDEFEFAPIDHCTNIIKNFQSSPKENPQKPQSAYLYDVLEKILKKSEVDHKQVTMNTKLCSLEITEMVLFRKLANTSLESFDDMMHLALTIITARHSSRSGVILSYFGNNPFQIFNQSLYFINDEGFEKEKGKFLNTIIPTMLGMAGLEDQKKESCPVKLIPKLNRFLSEISPNLDSKAFDPKQLQQFNSDAMFILSVEANNDKLRIHCSDAKSDENSIQKQAVDCIGRVLDRIERKGKIENDWSSLSQIKQFLREVPEEEVILNRVIDLLIYIFELQQPESASNLKQQKILAIFSDLNYSLLQALQKRKGFKKYIELTNYIYYHFIQKNCPYGMFLAFTLFSHFEKENVLVEDSEIFLKQLEIMAKCLSDERTKQLIVDEKIDFGTCWEKLLSCLEQYHPEKHDEGRILCFKWLFMTGTIGDLIDLNQFNSIQYEIERSILQNVSDLLSTSKANAIEVLSKFPIQTSAMARAYMKFVSVQQTYLWQPSFEMRGIFLRGINSNNPISKEKLFTYFEHILDHTGPMMIFKREPYMQFENNIWRKNITPNSESNPSSKYENNIMNIFLEFALNFLRKHQKTLKRVLHRDSIQNRIKTFEGIIVSRCEVIQQKPAEELSISYDETTLAQQYMVLLQMINTSIEQNMNQKNQNKILAKHLLFEIQDIVISLYDSAQFFKLAGEASMKSIENAWDEKAIIYFASFKKGFAASSYFLHPNQYDEDFVFWVPEEYPTWFFLLMHDNFSGSIDRPELLNRRVSVYFEYLENHSNNNREPSRISISQFFSYYSKHRTISKMFLVNMKRLVFQGSKNYPTIDFSNEAESEHIYFEKLDLLIREYIFFQEYLLRLLEQENFNKIVKPKQFKPIEQLILRFISRYLKGSKKTVNTFLVLAYSQNDKYQRSELTLGLLNQYICNIFKLKASLRNSGVGMDGPKVKLNFLEKFLNSFASTIDQLSQKKVDVSVLHKDILDLFEQTGDLIRMLFDEVVNHPVFPLRVNVQPITELIVKIELKMNSHYSAQNDKSKQQQDQKQKKLQTKSSGLFYNQGEKEQPRTKNNNDGEKENTETKKELSYENTIWILTAKRIAIFMVNYIKSFEQKSAYNFSIANLLKIIEFDIPEISLWNSGEKNKSKGKYYSAGYTRFLEKAFPDQLQSCENNRSIDIALRVLTKNIKSTLQQIEEKKDIKGLEELEKELETTGQFELIHDTFESLYLSQARVLQIWKKSPSFGESLIAMKSVDVSLKQMMSLLKIRRITTDEAKRQFEFCEDLVEIFCTRMVAENKAGHYFQQEAPILTTFVRIITNALLIMKGLNNLIGKMDSQAVQKFQRLLQMLLKMKCQLRRSDTCLNVILYHLNVLFMLRGEDETKRVIKKKLVHKILELHAEKEDKKVAQSVSAIEKEPANPIDATVTDIVILANFTTEEVANQSEAVNQIQESKLEDLEEGGNGFQNNQQEITENEEEKERVEKVEIEIEMEKQEKKEIPNSESDDKTDAIADAENESIHSTASETESEMLKDVEENNDINESDTTVVVNEESDISILNESDDLVSEQSDEDEKKNKKNECQQQSDLSDPLQFASQLKKVRDETEKKELSTWSKIEQHITSLDSLVVSESELNELILQFKQQYSGCCHILSEVLDELFLKGEHLQDTRKCDSKIKESYPIRLRNIANFKSIYELRNKHVKISEGQIQVVQMLVDEYVNRLSEVKDNYMRESYAIISLPCVSRIFQPAADFLKMKDISDFLYAIINLHEDLIVPHFHRFTVKDAERLHGRDTLKYFSGNRFVDLLVHACLTTNYSSQDLLLSVVFSDIKLPNGKAFSTISVRLVLLEIARIIRFIFTDADFFTNIDSALTVDAIINIFKNLLNRIEEKRVEDGLLLLEIFGEMIQRADSLPKLQQLYYIEVINNYEIIFDFINQAIFGENYKESLSEIGNNFYPCFEGLPSFEEPTDSTSKIQLKLFLEEQSQDPFEIDWEFENCSDLIQVVKESKSTGEEEISQKNSFMDTVLHLEIKETGTQIEQIKIEHNNISGFSSYFELAQRLEPNFTMSDHFSSFERVSQIKQEFSGKPIEEIERNEIFALQVKSEYSRTLQLGIYQSSSLDANIEQAKYNYSTLIMKFNQMLLKLLNKEEEQDKNDKSIYEKPELSLPEEEEKKEDQKFDENNQEKKKIQLVDPSKFEHQLSDFEKYGIDNDVYNRTPNDEKQQFLDSAKQKYGLKKEVDLKLSILKGRERILVSRLIDSSEQEDEIKQSRRELKKLLGKKETTKMIKDMESEDKFMLLISKEKNDYTKWLSSDQKMLSQKLVKKTELAPYLLNQKTQAPNKKEDKLFDALSLVHKKMSESQNKLDLQKQLKKQTSPKFSVEFQHRRVPVIPESVALRLLLTYFVTEQVLINERYKEVISVSFINPVNYIRFLELAFLITKSIQEDIPLGIEWVDALLFRSQTNLLWGERLISREKSNKQSYKCQLLKNGKKFIEYLLFGDYIGSKYGIQLLSEEKFNFLETEISELNVNYECSNLLNQKNELSLALGALNRSKLLITTKTFKNLNFKVAFPIVRSRIGQLYTSVSDYLNQMTNMINNRQEKIRKQFEECSLTTKDSREIFKMLPTSDMSDPENLLLIELTSFASKLIHRYIFEKSEPNEEEEEEEEGLSSNQSNYSSLLNMKSSLIYCSRKSEFGSSYFTAIETLIRVVIQYLTLNGYEIGENDSFNELLNSYFKKHSLQIADVVKPLVGPLSEYLFVISREFNKMIKRIASDKEIMDQKKEVEEEQREKEQKFSNLIKWSFELGERGFEVLSKFQTNSKWLMEKFSSSQIVCEKMYPHFAAKMKGDNADSELLEKHKKLKIQSEWWKAAKEAEKKKTQEEMKSLWLDRENSKLLAYFSEFFEFVSIHLKINPPKDSYHNTHSRTIDGIKIYFDIYKQLIQSKEVINSDSEQFNDTETSAFIPTTKPIFINTKINQVNFCERKCEKSEKLRNIPDQNSQKIDENKQSVVQFCDFMSTIYNEFPPLFFQSFISDHEDKEVGEIVTNLLKTDVQVSPEHRISIIESISKQEAGKRKKGESSEEIKIEVNRSKLWDSMIKTLQIICPSYLVLNPLFIQYQDENGYDGGGLSQEFYVTVMREFIDPNKGFFILSKNKRTIQPSPHARLIPNSQLHFQYAGRLIAKSIIDGFIPALDFTISFLKQIVGEQLVLSDLSDIDEELERNLKWILENDVSELGYDFTYTFYEFDKMKVVELIENGANVPVTEENKYEYVQLVADYKMTKSIQEEIKAIQQGFYEVIPFKVIRIMNAIDLGKQLSGEHTIDLEDLKKHIQLDQFTLDSPQIMWLFELLGSYTEEQKGQFLFFLTGTHRTPVGGFKNVNLSIGPLSSLEYLPVSHTCSSKLDLPKYSTKEILKDKLEKSIHEGSKGFFLS